MKDDISKKQELLIKFFNGEASPAEKEELQSWVNLSEENNAAFDALYDQEFIKEKLRRIEQIEGGAGVSWKAIGQNLPFATAKVIRPIWRRYVAAAVALLVLGGTGYFLFMTGNGNKEDNLASQSKQLLDMPPGSDKAVLTLADGSTIVLNSAASGNIASQGSIRIIKLTNGQLAYKNDGTGADSTSHTTSYNTISTPIGGQYQVVLPDGTNVWLNAASSIRFPTTFESGQREVYITGEVYFEVAKNAHHPFKVKTGTIDVDVLGTDYNINTYAEEPFIKTTLIQGSINVVKGNDQWLLKPGQQARQNVQTSETTIVPKADIEGVIAWKNGFFSAKNADMHELMRQIERWYNIKIIYEGVTVNPTFTGNISRGMSLAQVLKILKLSDVHFRIQDRKIVIIP